MRTFKIIGVMSGTSLDGLDLAYCEFREYSCSNSGEDINGGGWDFEIRQARTEPYPAEWHNRLQNAAQLSGLELSLLNADYGHYTGKCISEFIRDNGLQPDFAAVHGHTVFHQPSRGLTLQIGDGAAIAVECGLPVVCNFRTTDVALGGQGAPLVPIGDMLLFGHYDYRLNLGGIANISYKAATSGVQTAFDICPCNMALNYLAELANTADGTTGAANLHYDRDGNLARKGIINKNLLSRMNKLPFYSAPPPKSLGVEWFNENFKPLLIATPSAVPAINDLLATTVEHIAIQIANTIQTAASTPAQTPAALPKMLITGGGALNTCLMERIEAHTSVRITQTSKQLVEYKEALVFAFLGLLRMEQRPNALASVTGAKKDNTGGSIFLP